VTFVAYVIVAIVTGMCAQIDKGRLGIGWGTLTLVLELIAWMFGTFVVAITPELAESPYGQLSADIFAGMVGGVLGFLIVATLPKVHRPSKD
jgi:hypothetical protein